MIDYRGMTLGAWKMTKHTIYIFPQSSFFFFLIVGKCKRIEMQIINGQKRTKVSLSDKCLPNLNGSKCQILHCVWCLKESSLLILFHALRHKKNWKYASRFLDMIQLSPRDCSTLIHMHFTWHLYHKSLQPFTTILIRKLPRYANGSCLPPFLCALD